MKQESFWITNITNKNVSLADLNLTVKPFASINLLDKKRYQYTKEQLILSAQSGSLFKKQKLIAVRNNPPENKTNNKIPMLLTTYDKESKTWSENGTYIPSRERSVLEIEEAYYEELDFDGEKIDKNVSDEKFAEQNADLADLDEQFSIRNKRK